MFVETTETPLFWTTLEERRTYSTLASLSLSWPGDLSPRAVAAAPAPSSPTLALERWAAASGREVLEGDPWSSTPTMSPTVALKRWAAASGHEMAEVGPWGAPLTTDVEATHQPGCHDPYGGAAWCDCNNLTRADACNCDGSGCTWCMCDCDDASFCTWCMF